MYIFIFVFIFIYLLCFRIDEQDWSNAFDEFKEKSN